MYASVTVGRVSADRIDELPQLYRRFLPTLEAAQGWRGVYVIVDRATGDGHVIGLWETAEDAEAFESSGAFGRLLAEYPSGLLVGRPQRHIAEVVFHASPAEGG